MRHPYTLPELLEELDLARSSYFYYRARHQVADKYVEVRRTIADIFERNRRCYGYRPIRASLGRQCIRVSEKVVQRLMKQGCLITATAKRRRYSFYLGKINPAPENLLDRNF